MKYVFFFSVFVSLFFRVRTSTPYITQIPTRVVMVDHMGSAKENQMDSIMNGKGGDLFVWEEGVHGKSISSLHKNRDDAHKINTQYNMVWFPL